jgi:hypothetical protein
MQIDSDFEEFWSAYPRKVGKADARKSWARLTKEQKFAATAAVPMHIKYWEAAGRTKEYMPHPSTWINGERWEDELEMPVPEKQEDAWWASQQGIERKARELSMWPPRANESWHELKARIMGRLKAA